MGIKNTFISALKGDKRSVQDLFKYLQNIAVAYLKTKASRDNFLLQYLYSDFEDLALDCIADLFSQDGHHFDQLQAYLPINEAKKLSESEINTKIRQLVFSKVNDGLFRNYQKFDPSLSKIIRNLKRTLEEQKVDRALYNSESGFIEVGDCSEPLPVISDEILEIRLSSHLNKVNNMVDAVSLLKSIVNRENNYAQKIQIVSFAIILRKSFANLLEMEDYDDESTIIYSADELHKFISNSILKQKDQLHSTYVESGKVDRVHFSKLLAVATDILKADYIEESAREGYFEHFVYYFPEVTYDRYRHHHRKILEYLVKKIREQLIQLLKKEEKFSTHREWQGLL